MAPSVASMLGSLSSRSKFFKILHATVHKICPKLCSLLIYSRILHTSWSFAKCLTFLTSMSAPITLVQNLLLNTGTIFCNCRRLHLSWANKQNEFEMHEICFLIYIVIRCITVQIKTNPEVGVYKVDNNGVGGLLGVPEQKCRRGC